MKQRLEGVSEGFDLLNLQMRKGDYNHEEESCRRRWRSRRLGSRKETRTGG